MFDLIDLAHQDPYLDSWLTGPDPAGAAEAFAKAWEPAPDYSEHPEQWLTETLGEYAWSLQREIWRSVVVNRATAVPSCFDAGKSFIASRIIAWWIATHPIGEAFVVTTAPTAAQVAAILWREIGKAYRKAKERGNPLPGRILQSPFSQWKIGDELVGYGRKPADYEQAAFQGIHARYVLVVLDEAAGIAESLWNAVDGLLTNEAARVLAIGNPDDLSSHFAKICAASSRWNVIRIDGLRTPNFTEAEVAKFPLVQAYMEHERVPYATEEIPASLGPLLITPLWVHEAFESYCNVPGNMHEQLSKQALGEYLARKAEDSPLFMTKVRGIFAEGKGVKVIPHGWIQRAVERWKDWDSGRKALPASSGQGAQPARPAIPPRVEQPGRRVVGVDVAGEGDDKTAIAVRNGDIITELHRHDESDTMETADLVAPFLLNLPQAVVVVDVIGIGSGVRDKLRRDGFRTVAFNASKQSDRTDKRGEFRFNNDRSAAWWNLRELLDPSRPGGSTVMLPDDKDLIADLSAPTYVVRTSKGVGRIIVESKDEIRKRLGRSTDSGDTVVQAFWVSTAAVNPNEEPTGGIDYPDSPYPVDDVGFNYAGLGGLPGDGMGL